MNTQCVSAKSRIVVPWEPREHGVTVGDSPVDFAVVLVGVEIARRIKKKVLDTVNRCRVRPNRGAADAGQFWIRPSELVLLYRFLSVFEAVVCASSIPSVSARGMRENRTLSGPRRC